jgi:NitT/TauT family transport system substrate-binding protein
MRRHLSILIVFGILILGCGEKKHSADNLQDVTINEAVRTILYLPLYHAEAGGFFKKAGLDVKIVTGGTATSSFAAMLSGEADFSQADPMYVAISREQGGKTKVVAQVVARIAVWGLTMDTTIHKLDKKTLKGKTISTQVKPMTAYTYTVKLIEDNGLVPDKDVKIIQTQSPNEIIPLLQRRANYALTLEPNTSIAVSKGAKVVLSYPKLLGDQIFTGLMTREDFINQHADVVEKVVKAYQMALDDLHKNPDNGIASAKKYFPNLDDNILKDAINRMVTDKVIPDTTSVSEESWDKAIAVRLKVGDLKHKVSLKDSYYEVK